MSALLAGFLASCTSTPSRRDRGAGPKIEDTSGKLRGAEAVDYREIQNLFQRGNFEALIVKVPAFEKRFPRSTQTAQVRNLNGMAYLLTKRPLQSIIHFRRSIEASNQPVFRQFVMYNLAYAQFEVNQIEDANRTLGRIQVDSLDRDTRVKFHSLRGRVFLKIALPVESAKETLQLGRLLEESQPRAVFVAQLEQALANIMDPTVLEQLFSDYEDSPFADLVLFRLGSQEFAMGRPGSGEARLKLLMDRYPQSSRFGDAQDLLRSVQNQTVVNAKAIGVLLPMKGKFARFGQRSLQGIQLAFRIFNLDEPTSGITLVIEDSGEDAESAVRGLNNLFFKHHVIGVVGPLLSKGIDQVTQRAQELGIPLLTLAQQPGVQGDFVFPSALTPQMQAQAIARHAYEEMGIRKFAMLSPRDKFGEQYSQAFWDAVESMGGEIVGAEKYAAGDTDFRVVIDKLTGRHYEGARARELEALAKLREEQDIKKRNRRTEKFFALTPIVDFQAVFVPDEPKVVGQVLPTFAYRDISGIKFLGIATWNSPDLIARAQSYADGATFVDAFYPDSHSPTVKKFVERFQKTFGQPPGAIEALAFDAAGILEQVISSGGPKTRMDLRGQLQSVSGYPGVTGRVSYQAGQFLRSLQVLTVKGGAITEASK